MIWQKILEFFIINGWKIVAVLALIFIGLIIIRIIKRTMRRVFAKRNVENIVSYFITSIVNIILVILLIVAVFDMMGISTAPFVAIIGTVGLALALSMQDSLSNVASGIIIIITKPFKKGDYVDISGVAGSVQKITMLTTELTTFDNKTVIMPNNKVAKSEVINFSNLATRRVDFKFNVAYGSNINQVRQVIQSVIKKNPLILLDREPQIVVLEHASSSIVIGTRVWSNTADYWNVFFDTQEKIYNAFRDNNIEIPYSKMDVKILKND